MDIGTAIIVFLCGMGMGYGFRAWRDSRSGWKKTKREFEEFQREVRATRDRIRGNRFD